MIYSHKGTIWSSLALIWDCKGSFSKNNSTSVHAPSDMYKVRSSGGTTSCDKKKKNRPEKIKLILTTPHG